jgi:hypothetical protein
MALLHDDIKLLVVLRVVLG